MKGCQQILIIVIIAAENGQLVCWQVGCTCDQSVDIVSCPTMGDMGARCLGQTIDGGL